MTTPLGSIPAVTSPVFSPQTPPLPAARATGIGWAPSSLNSWIREFDKEP